MPLPQSSASLDWFVEAINKGANGLEEVTAYLDDGLAFDSDPSPHVEIPAMA